MYYDVSVIGLGRVGLPLALSFADRGLRVVGVDRDASRLSSLRDGRMPFREEGADEILARMLASGRLELSDAVVDAAAAPPIAVSRAPTGISRNVAPLRPTCVSARPCRNGMPVASPCAATGMAHSTAAVAAATRNVVIAPPIE